MGAITGGVLRSWLVLVMLASMLAAPSAALASAKLGLSSGTFKFEVKDGDSAGGTIVVMNDGEEDLNVMIYSADQEVDEKGDISYVAPTRADITQAGRPSAWIQLKMPDESRSLGNVPYIVLGPGEKMPVDFTINVPPGTAPGDHNLIVFFETFDQASQAAGAQMAVSGRLGARVTMRIDGVIVDRLSVRPFEVPRFVLGAKVPFSMLVNNEGNVDQRVSVEAVLRDRSGSDIGSAKPLDAKLVFAKKGIEAGGDLFAAGTPIGQRTVVAQIVPVDDDGRPLAEGRDMIVEEREVFMIPVWLLVAAGAALTLILAAALVALGRRSRGRSADAEPASGTAA